MRIEIEDLKVVRSGVNAKLPSCSYIEVGGGIRNKKNPNKPSCAISIIYLEEDILKNLDKNILYKKCKIIIEVEE